MTLVYNVLNDARRRSVTYVIGEPCIDIKDRACVDVCPVDCIHEVGRMFVIDPEECIDCGACEPECPVEAIFPEDVLPEKWHEFTAINAAIDGGAEKVDVLVEFYGGAHDLSTSEGNR
jgi:ferredoxin